METILRANRDNVSELYGIHPWHPQGIAPLKAIKEVKNVHSCNGLLEEPEDDINDWIHTCAGPIRVSRK